MGYVAANAFSFLYPNAGAPTTTLVFRAPLIGNREAIDRRDVIQETASGELIVYERGPTRTLLEWEWQSLDLAEKDRLLDFWYRVTKSAANEFDLKVPNWSGKAVTIFPGVTVAGSPIVLSGGYTVGQQVLADFIYYSGVSFEESALPFTESSRFGRFDVAVRMRARGRLIV
jgi:hypothetical protein